MRCLLVPGGGGEDAPREVLWPGFAEHWGRIYETLGAASCARWMELVTRSGALLRESYGWDGSDVQGGAVLQLAAHEAEWSDLCVELGWVASRSPRRLMSAGAASNLVTLDQAAGAAFVAGSASFDPGLLRRSLLLDLEASGCLVARSLHGITPDGEVSTELGTLSCDCVVLGGGRHSLRQAGLEERWLLPHGGVELMITPRAADWNPALSALEAHRGHLMITSGGNQWRVVGLAPEPVEDEAELVAVVSRLAGELLMPLQGVTPEASRPVQFTVTPDGLPVVGPLSGSRFWLCDGLGSRAWTFGPALGESLALALSGQDSLLMGLPEARPSRFFRL